MTKSLTDARRKDKPKYQSPASDIFIPNSVPDFDSVVEAGQPLVVGEVKAFKDALNGTSIDQIERDIFYAARPTIKGDVLVVTTRGIVIPPRLVKAADRADVKVGLWQAIGKVKATPSNGNAKCWSFELLVGKDKHVNTAGTRDPLAADTPPVEIKVTEPIP